MSRDALDAYAVQYVADFKAVRKKADVSEILLPGELKQKTIRDLKANGIPLSVAVIATLNAYADQIGVEHLA